MNNIVIIINSLLDFLINASIRTSILIAVIIIVKALLNKKMNTGFHYGIWYLVLISLVLPCFPHTHFSIYNIFNVFVNRQKEYHGIMNITNIVQKNAQAAQDLSIQTIKINFIFYFWISGVLILALFTLYKNNEIKKLIIKGEKVNMPEIIDILNKCRKELKIKTDVDLIMTDKICVPMLFGIIHPKVIISKEIVLKFDEKYLEYILLHELSHLKRRDLFMTRVLLFIQLVYWFNPIVWIAFYQMKNDLEMDCDAMALRHLNKNEHIKYGRVIISLIEFISKPSLVYTSANFINNKKQLKRRIMMIKNFKKVVLQ